MTMWTSLLLSAFTYLVSIASVIIFSHHHSASLQGLAPHHDDVEIFVCQTEGSKRWRLYPFRKGFAKPSQPSGDLAEDSLGEPIMDVTLQVL